MSKRRIAGASGLPKRPLFDKYPGAEVATASRQQATERCSCPAAQGQVEPLKTTAAGSTEPLPTAGGSEQNSASTAPDADQPSPAARRRPLVPSAKPDLPPGLHERLQPLAEAITKDFGQWLAAAPRRRDQLAGLLRALLPAYPSRRGRKRRMAVARAIELRRQGVAWQQVSLRCTPDYSAMGRFERQVRADNLRRAVRAGVRRGTAAAYKP